MRPQARHIWMTGLAVLAGLAVIGAVLGAVLAGGDDAPAASGGQARAGAQQVVDAIGAKWPAPNPRDTSSGCMAKAGDTGPGCVSRVTTDAVTVIELATEADAAKWANGMKASGGRQAGRFVLTWNGDQELTSDETRADMVTIAKGL